MAGYSGFSKSNNALEAESNGKRTASALAREIGGGATPAGVSAALTASEWHHTSSRYNVTHYYDLEELAEELAYDEGISQEDAETQLIEKVRRASRELTAEKKAVTVRRVEGRLVVADWAGTRNHPTFCPFFVEYGCEIKGDWAIFSNGKRKLTKNVRRVVDLTESNPAKAFEAGRYI